MTKKLQRIVFAICLVGFLGSQSCQNNKPAHLVQPVLPKQQFIDILADLHLAEAISNDRQLHLDSIGLELRSLPQYYADILDLHRTSYADFRQTFNYYVENPKEMDILYDELISILNKAEQQAAAVAKSASPPPLPADTVRTASARKNIKGTGINR